MARRPRLPSAQSRAPGQVRALMNGKERVGGTAAAHRKDGHFVGVAVITTCITWTDLVGGKGTPGTGTCCCRCRPAVPRTAAADLLLPVAPSSLLHQPEPAPPGPAMRLRRRAWAPSACWARRKAATVLPVRERGKRRRLRDGVVVALVPSPAADGECCLRRRCGRPIESPCPRPTTCTSHAQPPRQRMHSRRARAVALVPCRLPFERCWPAPDGAIGAPMGPMGHKAGTSPLTSAALASSVLSSVPAASSRRRSQLAYEAFFNVIYSRFRAVPFYSYSLQCLSTPTLCSASLLLRRACLSAPTPCGASPCCSRLAPVQTYRLANGTLAGMHREPIAFTRVRQEKTGRRLGPVTDA
ncbi:hypothetical protein RJ55_02767 [Drechmeria coniospora]|nr:hypothetical protein RJ55_02767 [Drechmeria coniospora]